MKRAWFTAKVLTGFFAAAVYAMPQATISARPGVINYIEGHAYIDGREIPQKSLGKATELATNSTLSTDAGKAELLLTPGVFLRIGENSAVRMISPSLTHTQVEVTRGEAMVEVAQLFQDNDIEIADHGGSVTLQKVGVYRINADPQPTVGVIDGEALVQFNDQRVELKKGHDVVLTAELKKGRFDTKRQDDLYAWSNLRSEYAAGASYASAKTVYNSSLNSYGNYSGYGYGAGYGSPYGLGYGYSGYGGYDPGWYWNSGWNTWGFFPGGGYAYSPFGWGFYSPGYVAYAPVVYGPVGGGGGVSTNRPIPVRTANNVPRIVRNPNGGFTTRGGVAPTAFGRNVSNARSSPSAARSSAPAPSFSSGARGFGGGGLSGGSSRGGGSGSSGSHH